ncbi:MAG: major capsid protein [Candidatus Paceibacterota bacterium]
MPQPQEVFVDPVLTNISVEYTNPAVNFISEKLFPTMPVNKETGIYFKYDKSNLRSQSSRRAGVTRANRVDDSMTEESYGPLKEHSLEYPITYRVLKQYDNPLKPREDATRRVTEKLYIEKEKELADMLADTAIVTQNVTLTGTDQWSDYANSDPFNDIQTGIDEIKLNGLVTPNRLVLGYQTWSKLKHHPDLLERVKYSRLGVLTTELMTDLFDDIQEVVIGSVVENTAAEGLTPSMSYVWGKHAWLAYVTPDPGLNTVSLGYHLQLENARMVDRWDEPQVKTEFVRVNDFYEPKLVAEEAVYLIKNAIA